MITKSIILNTDSYKTSHFLAIPENVEYISSYIESRGGQFKNVLFFGLQAFIKEYLTKPITADDILFAKSFYKAHGVPFNEQGWQYILEQYNGYLPIRISAAKEGQIIPTHNVLVTIENTDPKCAWLPQYVETAILRAVWFGTSVATLSHNIKRVIYNSLVKTADPDESGSYSQVWFKLHDFGSRGVSSFESAMLGDMAHLVSFMGTDTVSGVLGASEYYDADMAGFSIPATEHGVSTIYGPGEGEVEYANAVYDKFSAESGIFAIVSDTYNVSNFVENVIGTALYSKIVNGKTMVVVRPDSGDPEQVVIMCLELLEKKFGTTINSKGYKVLNGIRLIQGDGVNIHSIQAILANMELRGYSADNIAFGAGGSLLQGLNRDTLKFAQKASWVKFSDGSSKGIYKDPATDPGKRSKAGRLTLLKSNLTGEYFTGDTSVEYDSEFENQMSVVFENGILLKNYTFDEVRKTANSQFK